MFTFHNRFDIGQRYECEIPCILTGRQESIKLPTGFARCATILACHVNRQHYNVGRAASAWNMIPRRKDHLNDQNNAFCDDGISSDAVVKQLRAEPDD
ncbi:MAG: hypothetical protein QOF94_1623 [Acidobacteriaceae bacterium]